MCKGAWWKLTYFISSVPLLRTASQQPKGLLRTELLTPPLFENLGYYLPWLASPRMFLP